MSHRFLSLLPLLAGGFLAAPAAADRLLVAGPDGFVMRADTDEGVFEYFACQCGGGPITALAVGGNRLYAADTFGQVRVFHAGNGSLQGILTPDIGSINALAVASGSLFLGTEDGLVVRVDPLSGQMMSPRTVPAGVRAMIAHGGFLFVGAADGGIYRAPLAQGQFEYFTCFCFFNIQDLAVIEDDLVAVDSFGTVARMDLATGMIETAFSVGPTNSMAVLGPVLLFYYEGGAITPVDGMTGTPVEGGFTSPIAVDVMLVLPDEPRPRAVLRDPRMW